MTTRIDRMRAIAKVLWPEFANVLSKQSFVGAMIDGDPRPFRADNAADFLFIALAELAKRGIGVEVHMPHGTDRSATVNWGPINARWTRVPMVFHPTNPASHIDALLAAMAEACGMVAKQSPADEGGR